MTILDRLAALRTLMQEHQIDAYIIPSQDPHQSEYVAARWQGREWISGFTGSAGTVVVTHNDIGLWTDSRYFLQAETQLQAAHGSLHKLDGKTPLQHIQWIKDQFAEHSKVAIDGRLFSHKEVRNMEKALAKKSIQLVTDVDLLEDIWTDRPELPKNPVMDFPVTYTGESREEKLMRLRQMLREQECDSMLLTALDDIAWTMNIRGADVEFNPVVYAYLYVHLNKAIVFIDPEKVGQPLAEAFEKAGLSIQPYGSIWNFLSELSADEVIWIDPALASSTIVASIQNAGIFEQTLPVQKMKAIKNETEVQHIRHAMVKDGVALVRTFKWLEETLQQRTVKETELAEQLAHFRSQQEGYQGESFSAIIGYKGNGAIVHYRAEEDSCADIRPEGVLLVDSGGQYLNGTTDITRTFAFGDVDPKVKDAYTRVLKGHIALARATFPEGTMGVQLDILARQYLWDTGKNYGHGTGHGVGFFLNVHEPPQGFVAGLGQRGTTGFEVGMFSSNEPGYYEAGEFGIRIENLILAVDREDNEHGRFLCFDSLTLYPIATNMIHHSMLTPEEIKWLNDYHERVFHALAPQLTEAERDWLQPQCAAI